MAKRERKQSRLGIWSFALALAGLVWLVGVLVIGVDYADERPDLFETDLGAAAAFGLLLVLGFVCELVALGLAIGGLSQRRRRRHLAVAGFIIAGVALLFPLMR